MTSSPVGHDEAMKGFEQALASGRLPHAWLLAGPRGIGKATLARIFAERLLGGREGASARLAAGTHGDYMELNLESEKSSREILIENARQALEFLAFTPSESPYRVLLVDPAEALNPNAANALLKTLEEPSPHAVILLVSHRPGALLPTIRSRCRFVSLHVPSVDAFAGILSRIEPEIPCHQYAPLAALADGAPGEAVSLYRQEALTFYAEMLRALSPEAMRVRISLADRVAGKDGAAHWSLFIRLMPNLLGRAIRVSRGIGIEDIVDDETRALHAFASRIDVVARYEEASSLLSEAEEYYLNPRNAVLSLLG